MPITPEDAYALAAAEYDGGTARPGLLAQAQAEANGDEARTRATYLRLRARQILAPPEPPRAPPPMASPPPVEDAGLGPLAWTGIIAATLVVAALGAFAMVGGGGGEADSERVLAEGETAIEPERQPRPVIADMTCESGREQLRLDPGDLAGSVASGVRSLRDDPAVRLGVTVRNNGVAGDVVMAVVAYSDRQDGEAHRTETVYMGAGEERRLTYTFDPVPFSRGAQCKAWAVLPSESLDAFDALVASHRARPQPARPSAPPPPDPEPLPDLEPEPERPEVATPPITPDPEPDGPEDAETDGDEADTYEPVEIQ